MVIPHLPPAADDVHVGPVSGRGGRVGDRAVLEGQVRDVSPTPSAGTVPVALPPEVKRESGLEKI